MSDTTGWVNSLRKLSLDAAIPEVEAFVSTTLTQVAEADKLLEIAEAIRSGIRQNTTTAQGIKTQQEALGTLSILSKEQRLYEQILAQLTDPPPEKLALALHRNMASLIQAQLLHYQFYLPIPESLWLRLHRLYHLASEKNLTEQAPVDRVCYPAKPISLQALYCMALLLGCGRLNHLTPDEIVLVHRSLLVWCALVGVTRDPVEANDSQLVVDITAGTAPNFRKLYADAGKSISLYLQVDKLIERLDGLLPKEGTAEKTPAKPPPAFAVGAGTTSKELTPSTIRHLKSAWSEYIHREERKPTDETLQVCVGFDTVFFYLCGGQTVKDFVGAKMSLSIVYHENEDRATIEKQRSGDVWSAFLSVPEGNLVSGDIPAEYKFQRHFPEKTPGQTHPDHPVLAVQMKDISTRGCRLHWGASSPVAPAVGNLIGLRSSDGSGHWQVAEIAWKETGKQNEVITGVRVLSHAAFPVAVDIPLRLAINQNYGGVLLLPPESALGTSTVTFVTALNGLRQGEYVAVSQKGIEEKMQLSRLLRKTEAFEAYDCAFVVKPKSLAVERPRR